MKTGKIGPREWRVPSGDSRERKVCPECDYIEYVNPRIVVGVVVCSSDGRYLLGKRTISPRQGYWTIPAGFLELGESPIEGAQRECQEEMLAQAEIDQLIAVYHVIKMGQIHLMYRGRLKDDAFGVGEETSEVKLVHYNEIQFDELAFPTVSWAIKDHHRTRDLAVVQPSTNPLGEVETQQDFS